MNVEQLTNEELLNEIAGRGLNRDYRVPGQGAPQPRTDLEIELVHEMERRAHEYAREFTEAADRARVQSRASRPTGPVHFDSRGRSTTRGKYLNWRAIQTDSGVEWRPDTGD
jgi:hypothetical protein